MSKSAVNISRKLNRNIFGSTVYKAIDVLFNFLLVRFSIVFFGEEDYGIWLTVLSFFAWFSVIEFGIGSSFRNEITQLFSDKKHNKIKEWVSGAYRATTIIYISVIGIVLLLFNISGMSFAHLSPHIDLVFQISFILYLIHYIFFFLQTVLLATHQTPLTYLITAIQKGVLLLGILFFIYFDLEPSLSFICLWFSSIPLLVWSLSSWISYRNSLQKFKPSYRLNNLNKNEIFKRIKWPFFIIQISTLVILSTDNLIIIKGLSGSDVTNYNISFKYFNILIVLFNIILLPYWSSFAEANHTRNKAWIIQNIKRLIKFWILIAVGGIFMLLIANYFYNLWIGKPVDIPIELSVFMLISILLTSWNTIFAYFLNSISKTNWQMRLLIISAIINIPLSFYLLSVYGLTGVIMATCIVLLPLAIGLPIQCRSILKSFNLNS